MDLIPFEILDDVAKVLANGAKKYGRHNWRKGMDWSRLQSALLRHYSAFADGEDIDPDSGLPHMSHVIVNAMFLASYQMEGNGNDDRRLPSVQEAGARCTGLNHYGQCVRDNSHIGACVFGELGRCAGTGMSGGRCVLNTVHPGHCKDR